MACLKPRSFRTDWRILVVRIRSRATLAMVLVTKLTKIELQILEMEDVGVMAMRTEELVKIGGTQHFFVFGLFFRPMFNYVFGNISTIYMA